MTRKKWSTVLSGVATVSMALTTLVPSAFAASANNGIQYNSRTMNVGSGYTALVQGLVAKDGTHATEFLPIYYLMQGLSKLGYTVNWNGVTRTLNITTPAGVQVSPSSATVGTPGSNQMVIQMNGTNVALAPRVIAKDPVSGVYTTYVPIWYLNIALKLAGFTNTYNGSSWTLSGPAASQTGTLGSISVSGATNGTGTAASPAVSLNGAAISLSTTLKDASGNPLPNTAVTFNVSEYGNKPSTQPNVANASGTFIAPTTTSNADQYTVYTNSNGVATISVTGPAGQTYAYEVVASAPYAGAGNNSLTSQPAYVDFVANDTAGIAPYASEGTPFTAAMNASVPITVTLPENSAGQPQANVLLTLNVTTVNGDASANFVSSTGGLLGQTIQVTTNSAGVAQALLTSANVGTYSVGVEASSLPAGVTAPQSTYISFGQSGVASQLQNYNITSNSEQAGQNVTVSGTLTDASGNPVPNGQVIVVGNDTGNPVSNTGNANSGDFGYVTTVSGKSTVTDFPNVGLVQAGSPNYISLSQGMNATSSVGDLITADSNGNFSFTITDTEDSSIGTFSIYAVTNGQVASSTPIKSDSVTFTPGSTMDYISLAGTDYQADNNTYTALTGLSAANHSFAPVYLDPQNAAKKPLTGQNITYNLSVSNGGTVEGISSINSGGSVAQTLSINSANPGLSALTVDETYANGVYTFTVPGQTGSISSSSPDLALYVYNGNTGATTLTATSGSASATAAVTFGGGAPSFVQSFSPANSTLSSGQTEQITYQLQDDQGNPVPNGISTIDTADGANPLWITQVNGVTLAQSENMGTTSQSNYNSEPTPIPMGSVTTGYATVDIPGVVSWSFSDPTTVKAYSNASGDVTLTVQGLGTNYYVAPGTSTAGSLAASTNGTATTENFYTYQKKGQSWQLYVGQSAPSWTGINQTPQELGTMSIGGNGSNSLPIGSFSYGTSGTTGVADTGSASAYAISTSSVTAGGTYSLLSGPTGYNAADFSVNSSTGAVTVNSGATVGTYTVQYSLLGSTTTATFVVTNAAWTPANFTMTATSPSTGVVLVQGTAVDPAGNPIPADTTVYGSINGGTAQKYTTTSSGAYTFVFSSVTPGSVTASVYTNTSGTPNKSATVTVQ